MRIDPLCESAGLTFSPHLGGNSPFGQHLAMALRGVGLLEYRIDPRESTHGGSVAPWPKWSVSKNGYVVPTDEPGFGLGIEESLSRPFPA